MHKLISGAAVDLAFTPQLGYIGYPSLTSITVGSQLGDRLISLNRASYHRFFVVGRLVRIPLILLGGIVMAFGLVDPLRRAGQVSAIMWFTSPLVLGHGWLIMPDALSGTAAAVLLVTTLRWLRRPNITNVIASGLAWGASLSIKFTFCPIFLIWPLAVFGYRLFFWSGLRREMWLYAGGFLLQGAIALLVVIAAFGESQVGVTLREHDFRSERLNWLSQDECDNKSTICILRELPSPLPVQYLLGIDDQQLDLEGGYPAYLLGTWYRDGSWWWVFPAYAIKEQVAAWPMMLLVPVAFFFAFRRITTRWRRDSCLTEREKSNLATLTFCFIVASSTFFVLAMNGKMALNVRYVFPSLPAAYVSAGVAWQICIRRPRLVRWSIALLIAIAGAESIIVFPYFFSYINPAVGGMYRTPPALHASNFDGGQDLWRLERWMNSQARQGGRCIWTCLHGTVPVGAIRFGVRVPDKQLLRNLLLSRTTHETPSSSDSDAGDALVVMRGLGIPAPWNRVTGEIVDDEYMGLLEQLVAIEPDLYLSPTLIVFYLNRDQRRVP